MEISYLEVCENRSRGKLRVYAIEGNQADNLWNYRTRKDLANPQSPPATGSLPGSDHWALRVRSPTHAREDRSLPYDTCNGAGDRGYESSHEQYNRNGTHANRAMRTIKNPWQLRSANLARQWYEVVLPWRTKPFPPWRRHGEVHPTVCGPWRSRPDRGFVRKLRRKKRLPR